MIPSGVLTLSIFNPLGRTQAAIDWPTGSGNSAINSRLLAMKGAYPDKELEALPVWVNVESVEKLDVPYLHAERHLVIMSIPDQPNQ